MNNGQHGLYKPVCYHYLLKESPQDTDKARREPSAADSLAREERRRKLAPSAYGTLNKLGEEDHEEQNLKRILLGLNGSPIDIDHVTYGSECIKGYTQRDYKMRRSYNLFFKDLINVGDHEVRIFRISQHTEIGKQADEHDEFLF